MRAWRKGPSGRSAGSGTTGTLRTGAFLMTMLASTLWLTATLVRPRRGHRLPTPNLVSSLQTLPPPPPSFLQEPLQTPVLADVTQGLAASNAGEGGESGVSGQAEGQESQGAAGGGAGLETSVGGAEAEVGTGGGAQEGEKREAEEAQEEAQSPPPSPPSPPVQLPPPPPSQALRYVNYPGAKVCGPQWADSYARVHRSIRRAELPRRFITFKGPSGPSAPLGEQLMGVAATFVAALLSKRALIISAPQIRSTFVVGLIDWTPREFVPLEPSKDCSTAEECAALAVPEEEGTGRVVRVDLRNAYEPDFTGWIGRFPLEIADFLRPLENYTNVVVLANAGVLARIFSTQSSTRTELEALNIAPDTAFACIIRFVMRPRDRVLRLAAPFLEAYLPLAKQSVCVHLASAAGFEALSPAEQLSLFHRVKARELDCAAKVGARLYKDQERVTWVVASDSRQLKAMLQGWGTSLERVDLLANDLRRTGNASRSVTDASVAEWLAFTTCGAYVIPHNGFSKTAFAYSLLQPVAFLLSLGADSASHDAACDPANPSTLADFQPFTGL